MTYQAAENPKAISGNDKEEPTQHPKLAAGGGDDADPAVAKQRFLLGIAYMMAMGVCGIVLVAIGSNLKQLAANCHTTTTHLGTVFIMRGVGAIFGAILSAKIYRWAPGNRVMMATMVILTALIMVLPVVGDVYTMHLVFCLLGMCTSVTDTGCQIQTRKVHGAKAGPWLGINTVVFSISGAFVPLIALATDSLFAQCAILAAVTLVSALLLCVPKAPESLPPPAAAFAPKHAPRRSAPQDDETLTDGSLGSLGSASGSGQESAAAAAKIAAKEAALSSRNEPAAPLPEKKSFKYIVELLASFEALWLIGGKVAATSYLSTYVDYVGSIPAKQSGLLIVMLWVGISLGRVVGIFDQIGLPTDRLYRHVYIQLWLGAGGMLAVLIFPNSGVALWTGVLVYGFFNGPTIGYVYDLCNRTTAATEKGMSIVMFGLNLGASLVPFMVSFAWDHGGGPATLPAVVMASHLLPIPCQYLIRRLTRQPFVVTWRLTKDVLFRGADYEKYPESGRPEPGGGAGGAASSGMDETESLLGGTASSSTSSSSSTPASSSTIAGGGTPGRELGKYV